MTTIRALALAFLLALFLRTAYLSALPPGLHVDEVKVGWNAYSLALTGRDDWGHAFPLHYNSFGDFRPTGYFYLSVVPIYLLGLTEFSTRLAPAVFGALSVFPLFWLTYRLTRNRKIAMFASLILALSPWHISLSRGASEGIIAVCLVLVGLTYLRRHLHQPSRSASLLSLIFFSLSYFMYHSARLLSPILALVLVVSTPRPRPTSRRVFFVPAFLLLLTVIFAFHPAARGRFNQVSILAPRPALAPIPISLFDKSTEFAARIVRSLPVLADQYTHYLNPRFYVSAWEAKPYRYATTNMGLLTYVELSLVVVGLVGIVRGTFPVLPLIFLMLSPLPAALTLEDAPNLHRSLFGTPFMAILAACGLYTLLSRRRLFNLTLTLFVLNFLLFTFNYVFQNPLETRILDARNYGTSELIMLLPKLQQNYSRILLTNDPDHLYPWFGFYLRPDPALFNFAARNRDAAPWVWDTIQFSHAKCPSRLIGTDSTVLAVDKSDCVEPGLHQVAKVSRPDTTDIFSLWTLRP